MTLLLSTVLTLTPSQPVDAMSAWNQDWALTQIEADPRPVERWRPLVAAFFDPDDVEFALCLIRYESSGDSTAKNPGSSASGLFQHLARYWPERTKRAGWDGASIWDPVANTAVAAWLLDVGGPSHWVGAGRCGR